MAELLSGTTAVVTGTMSGIGRAITSRFAEHGADVVVADVRKEPREATVPAHELIEDETDVRATDVNCDVTGRGGLVAAMDAAGEFGGVAVMVNNAGIFRGEEFLSVSEEEFDQLIDINVKGVFFGTQAAGERMIEAGGGSIVNLSSVAGLEGTGEYVSYWTSKGAVRLMTYSTAAALGPNGTGSTRSRRDRNGHDDRRPPDRRHRTGRTVPRDASEPSFEERGRP